MLEAILSTLLLTDVSKPVPSDSLQTLRMMGALLVLRDVQSVPLFLHLQELYVMSVFPLQSLAYQELASRFAPEVNITDKYLKTIVLHAHQIALDASSILVFARNVCPAVST